MRIAACVFLALASLGASAQTMKRCTVDGKTVYTDQACAPSDVVKEVRITDNTVDLSAEKRIAERDKQEQSKLDAALTAEVAKPSSSDCDYALSQYKQLQKKRELAVGKQRFIQLERTPEAAAVRAKCGEGTVPLRLASPAGHDLGRKPIPSSTGGVFTPVAGGYMSPKGEFCVAVAGGLSCPGRFVPVN